MSGAEKVTHQNVDKIYDEVQKMQKDFEWDVSSADELDEPQEGEDSELYLAKFPANYFRYGKVTL